MKDLLLYLLRCVDYVICAAIGRPDGGTFKDLIIGFFTIAVAFGILLGLLNIVANISVMISKNKSK